MMQVYNNLTIEELLYKIEAMTTIPFKQISLKVVEDTVIRRIDRQIKNVYNPNVKNTLKDVKVVDNTSILVETKEEDD